MLVLALLILTLELARHHEPAEAALIAGLLIAGGWPARWLARDLRLHAAGFPEPTQAEVRLQRGS